MSGKVEAHASHRFRATAEQVYDAWLDPVMVRVWMAAALRSFGLPADIRRIEIDARVGGKFHFSDMRGDTEARHWGTYLELDRPRRIVFTWIVDESEEASPSTVTLSIEPAPDGCIATIVHEMDAAWSDFTQRTADGWGRMLREIDHILSSPDKAAP